MSVSLIILGSCIVALFYGITLYNNLVQLKHAVVKA